MVKFIAIFLSVFYNVVSVGATLQVHTCGSNILWSISGEEDVRDSCPMCHMDSTDTCHDGDCQDIELKLDQLSDKLFAHTKDAVQLVDSAIITLPWILKFSYRGTLFSDPTPKEEVLAYTNSSPPTYLLLCTFRI